MRKGKHEDPKRTKEIKGAPESKRIIVLMWISTHKKLQIKLNNISEAQKTLDLVKRINPSTNGLAKMEEELSTLK